LARKPTKGFVCGKSNVVPAIVAPAPVALAPVPRVSLNSRLSTAPTPGRTPSRLGYLRNLGFVV